MRCVKQNPQTGRFESRIVCDSCALLRINGVVCHETGCPEAWKDEKRECKECGSVFTPMDRDDRFCTSDCLNSYHGQCLWANP